ncbi:MAG: GTPase family protein [Microcoleus sp.]
MPASDDTNKAINRSEALVTEILKIVDNLPNFVPIKGERQEYLNNLRSAMQGLRPPRIMVIGRSRSGKSSLINAICGLRVAEMSDTKPETGKAEWKDYHHNGVDLLHILDTRGLEEAEAPRKADSAKDPFDSIMQAVNKECPDVVLFICKATEVHAGSQKDIDICTLILTEIKNKYKRDLPMIGVLTKCDEIAPPKLTWSTNDERKNRNIDAEVKNLYGYLQRREKLRFHIFVMHKHQNRIAEPKLPDDIAKAWAKWFEEVDRLEVTTNQPESEYQQLLLNKYRQQGLEMSRNAQSRGLTP